QAPLYFVLVMVQRAFRRQIEAQPQPLDVLEDTPAQWLEPRSGRQRSGVHPVQRCLPGGHERLANALRKFRITEFVFPREAPKFNQLAAKGDVLAREAQKLAPEILFLGS